MILVVKLLSLIFWYSGAQATCTPINMNKLNETLIELVSLFFNGFQFFRVHCLFCKFLWSEQILFLRSYIFLKLINIFNKVRWRNCFYFFVLPKIYVKELSKNYKIYKCEKFLFKLYLSSFYTHVHCTVFERFDVANHTN